MNENDLIVIVDSILLMKLKSLSISDDDRHVQVILSYGLAEMLHLLNVCDRHSQHVVSSAVPV